MFSTLAGTFTLYELVVTQQHPRPVSLLRDNMSLHNNRETTAMCQMFAGQPQANYEFQTRSLRINGQCTSIRLEQTFWDILDEIAQSEGSSTPQFISRLHSEVVDMYGEARNFTSLLRCSCLVHKEKQHQTGKSSTRAA